MSKICEYCGTDLTNDATVCPSCGKPVRKKDSTMSKNDVFVEHLIGHMIELGYPIGQAEKIVCCTICGKKIDEIYMRQINDR